MNYTFQSEARQEFIEATAYYEKDKKDWVFDFYRRFLMALMKYYYYLKHIQ
jgi:hypothetical protein